MTTPITFECTAGAMVPLKRFHNAYRDAYEPGKTYRLAEVQDRSWISHNHQFAWLKTAWLNLPEAIADLYPTPEHLRKRALIEAGFYNEDAVDCGSNAAALRVASYVRSKDDFALVIVRGVFVIVRTAKSQSRRAMKKQEFQASKTAIIEIIENMIGAERGSLEREAGKAA